jgi:Protein of unknown function, DUF547
MKQFDSLLLVGLVLFSCHKDKQPAAVTGVPRPASAPVVAESQPAAPTSQPVAVVTPEPPASEPVATDPAPPFVAPLPTTMAAEKPPEVAPKPKPLDAYDALLKAYVSGGKVDYAGFKKERAQLDDFLSFVAKASSSQKLAFWINAYNAAVIAALLDEGLPKKVTNVSGFFDAKKYTFAGKKMTLNELENKIRADFKDPRIHFALNCGARSCPPLPAKAFRDSSLDKTLNDLTSKFLNGSGVKVDEVKKEIQVTMLMNWYGDDFKEKEGSVEAYLKKWVTETIKKAALDAGGYKIGFLFYDWSINKK